MSKFGKLIEKKIKGNLIAIKNGTKTIQEAGVNSMIERLEKIDQASAEELQKEYLKTVKEVNDKKKD